MTYPGKIPWGPIIAIVLLVALMMTAPMWLPKESPITWTSAGNVTEVTDIPGSFGYTGHTVIRTETHVFRSRTPVGAVALSKALEYGTRTDGREYVRIKGSPAIHGLR